MFDGALQLRAGIRAYLQCDPAERRQDNKAVRSLNTTMKLFPLLAEAEDQGSAAARAPFPLARRGRRRVETTGMLGLT